MDRTVAGQKKEESDQKAEVTQICRTIYAMISQVVATGGNSIDERESSGSAQVVQSLDQEVDSEYPPKKMDSSEESDTQEMPSNVATDDGRSGKDGDGEPAMKRKKQGD